MVQATKTLSLEFVPKERIIIGTTEDNGAIQETVPEIKRGRGTIRL